MIIFNMKKMKDGWGKRSDEYKVSLLRSNGWIDGGRLPNAGKAFSSRLAADAVADVNAQCDENDIYYPREAMIICDLARNRNGHWEARQLKTELNNIINKHRALFENTDGV